MVEKYSSIVTFDKAANLDWSLPHDNCRWYIEEKIDGSQLSFYLNKTTGEVLFYNKGKQLQAMSKVFANTMSLLMRKKTQYNPHLIYHGEAVTSRQHNVVKYNRVPKLYFVLYDVYDTVNSKWLSPNEKLQEGQRLDLEVTPLLYENSNPGISPDLVCTRFILEIESGKVTSLLGGQPEGIVLKHNAFSSEGKTQVLRYKTVLSKFQETHGKKISKERATPETIIHEIGRIYAAKPRFFKAYAHLRDASLLTSRPEEDLPKLKAELYEDLTRECKEEILECLWTELRPFLEKSTTEGIDKFYLTLIKRNGSEFLDQDDDDDN